MPDNNVRTNNPHGGVIDINEWLSTGKGVVMLGIVIYEKPNLTY